MLKILETHEMVGILALFLIVQFTGLLVAMLVGGTASQAAIVNRLLSANSMYLSYGVDTVLALVILLLLLNRHRRHNQELWKHRYFVIFEAVVLTATAFFAFLFLFTAILPQSLQGYYFLAALAAALFVVAAREKTHAAKNMATVISSIGVGLVLGFYFSFEWALLILAVVALYDYVSVFVTKSMIKLANTLSMEDVAFLISEQDVEAIPPDNVSIGEIAGYTRALKRAKEDRDPLFKRILEGGEIPVISQIQLGEGDLGLPLMAVVSAYFTFSVPFMAIALASGAALGLIIAIGFLKKFRTALPAIPPLFATISIVSSLLLLRLGTINTEDAASLAVMGLFVIIVGMGATLLMKRRREQKAIKTKAAKKQAARPARKSAMATK